MSQERRKKKKHTNRATPTLSSSSSNKWYGSKAVQSVTSGGADKGDAGQRFTLRFSYNSLAVESTEFNVKPDHMFVSMHPSNGQYVVEATHRPVAITMHGSRAARSTHAV
jgi:hypothetical protein